MKTKKGFIIGVHNMGSIWQIDVAKNVFKGTPKGEITTISGDWRPISEGLEDAFGNDMIGQQIRYTPDPTFGATSWEPTGIKKKLKEVL
jgi:hypothetical protein